MRIYACGCSLTYGTELTNPSESSWPALLAKKLNAELVNASQGGSSNQRILYQTIKHLQHNYDLYLIAWSEYSRYTFYKSNNNHAVGFFNIGSEHPTHGKDKSYRDMGKLLYKEWYNELFAFKLWLQQIIQLQKILENSNYVMINSFQNELDNWLSSKEQFIEKTKHLINFDLMNDDQIFDEHKEIQYYISVIDKTKFYRWNDFHITQLCSEFKYGPGHHILEEGHEHLANLIYQHICSK
jgi:hypothetical protein